MKREVIRTVSRKNKKRKAPPVTRKGARKGKKSPRRR